MSQRLPSTLWHAFLSTLRANSGARASSLALVSPPQKIRWSYEELAGKVRGLSLGLKDRGIGEEDIVVTDLPNVAETLVLYLACSRIGAALATARTPQALKSIPEAQLAVSTSPTSFISHQSRAPPIIAGKDEMRTMLEMDAEDDNPLDDDNDELAALLRFLGITESDVSFVPVTLYNEFGLGTACTSTILSGAPIVIPAIGIYAGCGDAMLRARETVKTMVEEECTLLFADGSTMKSFNEACVKLPLKDARGGKIRNGLFKSGPGSEFLDRRVYIGECTVQAYGKAGKYGNPIEIS